MKIYNVPTKALQTLTDIAQLSPAAAREVGDFLAANLEGLTTPDQALQLTTQGTLKKVAPDVAFRWFHSLLPFIFDVVSSAQDSYEVVNDLVSAAQRESDEKFSQSIEKKMRANLLAIFDNQRTKLKAKSLRLLNTHARKLSDCEIISDIRPVFKTDGGMAIEAAVMYHTLRLAHTAAGADFYISLDSRDLVNLGKVIERAVAKEAALTKLIENAGVEQVKVS